MVNIADKVEELKYNIPESLLKDCEWFYPIQSPTKEALLTASKVNAQRFEECYYLNRSKAEFLKVMRNKNGN